MGGEGGLCGGPTVWGHPVHTGAVHFPLGLLPASSVWDALALGGVSGPWWSVSFWTLALGCLLALPALATGFLDYLGLPEDHPAEERASRHMWAALSGVALYGADLLWRLGPERPVPGSPWGAALVGLAGLAALAVAGWLGGDLVLRFGLGRTDSRKG